jgi:hypothetical protein
LSDVQNGSIIDIIKTLNFSNCNERRALHFGLTGLDQFEPGENRIGKFLSVSVLYLFILYQSLELKGLVP